MQRIDWDGIQERQEGEFDNPAPGGYVVKIVRVSDNEAKEYLEIRWDFTEAPYVDANRDTYVRAGFWPVKLFRSYKEKALPFFKAFKTALEESNPGYRFDERALEAMEGKRIGVVLGLEEYVKPATGEVKERLYVHQVRSVQVIRDRDFKVPEKKRLQPAKTPAGGGVDVFAADFLDAGDDRNIPF